METLNRKLIRPNFNGAKEQANSRRVQKPKSVPPEQTHAESFYYLKQMQGKTPMTFVLSDGETLHGAIEWYDRNCLKITRDDGPNMLVYKPSIKYMYKVNS